jgi:uncharacterized C2H2 Zn-finger protein
MIIRAWCDRCESLGNDRTEAKHIYSIGMVKGETRPAPRVIELCDECDAAIDWLPKLLADHSLPLDLKHPAVVPTPAAKAPSYDPGSKETCLICDTPYHKSSLAQHIRAVHRNGLVQEQPLKCPDCGLVKQSGMGQHRSQAHGWSAITEAYGDLVRRG